jgi:hypothetical protein
MMSPANDQSRTASSVAERQLLLQPQRDRGSAARDPARDEPLRPALGLVVVDDARARVQAVLGAHRADELVRGELGDRVRRLRPARRVLPLRALARVAEDRPEAGTKTRISRVDSRTARGSRRSSPRSRSSSAAGAARSRARTTAPPGGRSRGAHLLDRGPQGVRLEQLAAHELKLPAQVLRGSRAAPRERP